MIDSEELDDDEKWRLVNESGVLQKLNPPTTASTSVIATAAFLFTIPLAALFVLMEILVHQQFSEERTAMQVARERLPTVGPALYVLVFLVHYFVNSDWLQYCMTFGAAALGSRMMYLVLGQHTYGVMLSVPGIAVGWIYFIAQLRLSLAMGSLVLVATYVVYHMAVMRQEQSYY
ncbi:hypothetical protein BCR44DRAFT_115695 [Catenaria anguillulae PL171]|uniref:DUF7719 domain-containing protein n=1 Tax=Catenaria anguillulae PL171 TaxID=765915 RepID=A0A1Y2HJM1_9FUNG|nr:hypothetical protein BCR44DRAFT_115695 [Catenaria anguillulae PL171]